VKRPLAKNVHATEAEAEAEVEATVVAEEEEDIIAVETAVEIADTNPRNFSRICRDSPSQEGLFF